MAQLLNQNPAPGAPGITPRWARSDKDGVGTAYAVSSRVWFTVAGGVLEEVCFPTIDRPQIRDLQFLVTDGKTFFHDRRHLRVISHDYLAPHALGFRIVSTDDKQRYRITREILSDPHESCVLIHTRLEAADDPLAQLRLFALLAPHLDVGGWGNNGNVARTAWGDVLTA